MRLGLYMQPTMMSLTKVNYTVGLLGLSANQSLAISTLIALNQTKLSLLVTYYYVMGQ